MHREKWLDCRARITSKELAPLHSVKSGILQSACSTSQKMDAELGKSALMHTARLMNSLDNATMFTWTETAREPKWFRTQL